MLDRAHSRADRNTHNHRTSYKSKSTCCTNSESIALCLYSSNDVHHMASERSDDRLAPDFLVRWLFRPFAVSDDDDAHDPSASAHEPLSPSPLTRRDILAVLKTIRGRAIRAAAVAGDNKNSSSSSNSYGNGGSNVYSERGDGEDDGDLLSCAADLEAALEATDVSDENLRALADALAAEANMADCSFQLLLRRRSASTTSTERWPRLALWTAVARALIRPHWPSPGCFPPMAAPRQGLGPVTSIETFSMSEGVRLLRRWHGLRLPVPCKHLLSTGSGGAVEGDRAPVTCLAYLPLSMLLVSGYSDGMVRLWDPCARRHKLAPPPPAAPATRVGGRSAGSGEARGRDGLGRGRGRHLRLFPGSYADTAEEWTEKGQTFGCVATFGAVPAMTTVSGKRGGVAGGDWGGFLKVGAVNSIVLPGEDVSSLVVCNPERARVAQAMDEEQPWDPASAGECVVGSACLGTAGGCLPANLRQFVALYLDVGLSSSHTLAGVVDIAQNKRYTYAVNDSVLSDDAAFQTNVSLAFATAG